MTRPGGDLVSGLEPRTYADLVELAADAIVVCDEGGRVLWANAQVEQLLGWRRADLVGRPVEALVPPALKTAHLEHRRGFHDDPRSRAMGMDLTLTAVRADGSEVPVEISLTPIVSGGGRLVAAAIRDASQRRSIEQALEVSREQLQKSLDSMLDGFGVMVAVRDRHGVIEDFVWSYANEEAARTFHRSVGEVVGQRLTDVAPGVKATPYFAAYVGVVETGEGWMPEPFPYADDGVEGVFEVRAWKRGDGVAVMFRDVSRTAELAERLAATEATFHDLLAGLPDAVALLSPVRDETGRLVDLRWDVVNRVAALHAGYTVEELRGRTLCEVYPEQGPGRVEACRDVLDGSEPHLAAVWSLEGGRGDAALTRRLLDVRAVPVGDRLMVVSRDVTAERDREAELEQRQSELERSNAEMRQLNELADLLQGCQSPQEAYDVAAGLCERLFPGTAGSLAAVASSRDLVDAKVGWGRVPAQVRAAYGPVDCWALRRGQAHVSGRGTPRCPHLGPPAQADGPVLCVPMAAQGQTSGAFHLFLAPGEEVSPGLRQLALTVSAQLSLAISNLELRETLRGLSIRDPLTGLFNRRYMEETLVRELARADRQGTPLAVLQLDLDHFKRINDEHGHDAGDAVLRVVSQVLRVLVRDGDVVCRYGGEEFTAILPGADAETALGRMADLRVRLRETRVPFRGFVLDAPTVSGGLATYPVDGLTGDDLVRAADQALYQAKDAGRDRVVTVSAAPAG